MLTVFLPKLLAATSVFRSKNSVYSHPDAQTVFFNLK